MNKENHSVQPGKVSRSLQITACRRSVYDGPTNGGSLLEHTLASAWRAKRIIHEMRKLPSTGRESLIRTLPPNGVYWLNMFGTRWSSRRFDMIKKMLKNLNQESASKFLYQVRGSGVWRSLLDPTVMQVICDAEWLKTRTIHSSKTSSSNNIESNK